MSWLAAERPFAKLPASQCPQTGDAHDARFLRMRLEQLRTDTAANLWLVRAVVLRKDSARQLIGHVGFHGPPKDNAAELGYTIFLPHRRHGHATEAVIGLMDWARGRGVERFILSIAPSNAPYLSVARRLGFKRVGRQIDEEDGLEYVFELKAT
ncbi:MAG TPA: GNAT family N-acetyltransferase [Dehalococcoidia bacterium]|nr:GNAT family N-acetyltransferase [Dehalococcoidia bacterium]